MTTTPNRQSAKIYPFPVRPRVASNVRREMQERGPNAVLGRSPPLDCGGAWYHSAAITDDDLLRKR